MAKCPYTWFVGLFGKTSHIHGKAQQLRVSVAKDGVTTVNVAQPADSARWLIDLIPSDVMIKIRQEGIPIDQIQSELAKRETLSPQQIFSNEEHRAVDVWLE